MRVAWWSALVFVPLLACGVGFDSDGTGGGMSTSGPGGSPTGTGGTGASGGAGAGTSTGGTGGTGGAGGMGTGGTGGTGGMGTGGSGGETECDPLFNEAFDGNLTAWEKINSGGDTVIVSGAAIVSPGQLNGDFALIYTDSAYPLTDCGARVQVVQVNVPFGSFSWFGATVANDGGKRIEIAIVGGELQLYYIDNNSPGPVHTSSYTFATQSWMRMRHVSPNVLVETAPAQTGPWTLVVAQPAPSFINENFNYTLGVTNVGSNEPATYDNVTVFDSNDP